VSKKLSLSRMLPLVAVAIVLFLFFYFRLYEYLSFDALQENRGQLLAWTQQYYLWVVLAYMGIYIVAVAVSVPGATLLTLAGGFLFGLIYGTLFVVISATIGATLLFLAVKTALGDWLASRATSWIAKVEKGFQEDAFNYLLFLRLVPLVPFWVINITAGLLNVRTKSFFVATLVGIIPGSFVYVSVGNGLGSIFDAGIKPDLSIIFQPQILLPILGLAILSLVPLGYKHYKSRKSRTT